MLLSRPEENGYSSTLHRFSPHPVLGGAPWPTIWIRQYPGLSVPNFRLYQSFVSWSFSGLDPMVRMEGSPRKSMADLALAQIWGMLPTSLPKVYVVEKSQAAAARQYWHGVTKGGYALQVVSHVWGLGAGVTAGGGAFCGHDDDRLEVPLLSPGTQAQL